MPACQGREQPLKQGVKEWISEQQGRQAAPKDRFDHLCAGAAIGPPVGFDSPGDFVGADAGVAGNERAVRDAHDEGGVVLAAIGVDEQAGEQRQRRRGAGQRREPSRHLLGANVIGDMALERIGRQAEVAIGRRQRVARMVAEQDQALVRRPRDQVEGPEGVGDARGRISEWIFKGRYKFSLLNQI